MKIGSDNEDDSHNDRQVTIETESATGVYDVIVYYTIFILF